MILLFLCLIAELIGISQTCARIGHRKWTFYLKKLPFFSPHRRSRVTSVTGRSRPMMSRRSRAEIKDQRSMAKIKDQYQSKRTPREHKLIAKRVCAWWTKKISIVHILLYDVRRAALKGARRSSSQVRCETIASKAGQKFYGTLILQHSRCL